MWSLGEWAHFLDRTIFWFRAVNTAHVQTVLQTSKDHVDHDSSSVDIRAWEGSCAVSQNIMRFVGSVHRDESDHGGTLMMFLRSSAVIFVK
jgi:hypothetical protein